MKLRLNLLVFSIAISATFGYTQSGIDSLVAKWKLVEEGRLEMEDSLQARLLLDIGVIVSYDAPDSSFEYFEKALQLSQNGNLKSLTGDILNRIGYTNYILGNYDLALVYFVDGLELHQAQLSDMGIATSLNHISLIYETQKNYQQALKFQWRSMVHS
ncbi:MAG: tetratricopeptide repeat protein, partial [Cyclobacteriaceae bacterium]